MPVAVKELKNLHVNTGEIQKFLDEAEVRISSR